MLNVSPQLPHVSVGFGRAGEVVEPVNGGALVPECSCQEVSRNDFLSTGPEGLRFRGRAK
jgi:hypothetical protein